MIINYIISQLKLYWRQPLWLLVCALLALPMTMLAQLSALTTDLVSARFISGVQHKAVQSIYFSDVENVQALPLYIAKEVEQNHKFNVAYERTFSTFVKLPEKHYAINLSAFSGGFNEFGIESMLGNLSDFPRQLLHNKQLAVLSYAGWYRLFNADPSVIGRWVSINNQQFQIIAVLDKSFSGFRQLSATDVIVPFSTSHLGDGDVLPDTLSYLINQRLPLADLANVEQHLRDNFLITEQQHLGISPALGMPVSEFNTLNERIKLLQWLIVFLLLFCFLAYSGILLNEQQKRHDEYQLRLMLGASAGDLQLQRWVELVMNGAMLMIMCGVFLPLQHSLIALLLPGVNIEGVAVAATAFGFSLCGAIAIVALGLAICSLQDRVMATTLGRGQTQSLWQKVFSTVLVSIQLSLAAFSSFVAITLLVKQLHLYSEDLGFQSDSLYVLTFDPLAVAGGNTYESSLAALFQSLKLRVPDLEVAAAVATPLSSTYMFGNWTTATGATVGNVNGGGTYSNRVSLNYFQVMQTPLLLGRLYYPQSTNEIVVNKALWQRYFNSETLLGANLQHQGESYRIVGVVENIRYQGPDQKPQPMIYQPLGNLFEFTQLLIRSDQAVADWQDAVLDVIAEQNPSLVASPFLAMSERVRQEHAQRVGIVLLMLLLSAGGVTAAGLFTYANIRQLLVSNSTDLALRFSFGARLHQLVQQPLAILLGLLLAQLLLLHIFISPKLNIGSDDTTTLLLVVVTTMAIISGLMLWMYRQVTLDSWKYLTR